MLANRTLVAYFSKGGAAESERKFLDPLVEKYGLETVRHDPLPGKIPVGGGELEDRTDPELACRWAEDLARALSG